MIYIDKYGHMVADTLNELHQFAFNKVGIRRHFFQGTRKGTLITISQHRQRKSGRLIMAQRW